MEKIDLVALREAVRANYANHPSNGDAVLAFESRNADLIADLAVLIVRESSERQTPIEDILQGITAIIATPLENLISQYKLDPRRTVAYVAQGLSGYIISAENVTPDQVVIPRRDVGDA
jgi:hypothetical protein